MGLVKDTFPPVSMYNDIPFIHDAGHVAETYADDLEYLKELLRKHNIPPSICIKLIHIHFHLHEGGIVAFRELNATPHGQIPFLGPMTPDAATKVHGCHYIVDDAGDLQAFEYTTIAGGMNIEEYPAFVAEFCAAVTQRNIQDKFGLAIKSGVSERGYWTELDYPEKRATFLLPDHVPLPESDDLVMVTTRTQFASSENQSLPTHVHAEHSWSRRLNSKDSEPIVDGISTKGGLFLTGVPLDPSSAFYSVVSAISAAA